MTKVPSNSLPNVVIVGGGGAGQKIARTLSGELDPKKANLILVTSRPFYVHLPAALRMVVTSKGNLEDMALISYESNFINGNGTLVVSTVVSVQPSSSGKGGDVVLEDGEKIPYSILVLAPGSTWEGPLAFPNTRAETIEAIKSWRQKFERASDIVLAGGGAVGIELAAEIKEIWPNKNVTIVQGDKLLLNDAYPLKFRKNAERAVLRHKITLVLGDYIDAIPPEGSGSVTTRNGQTIRTDLVVPTRGGRPNTAFIRSSLGDAVVSPSGFVHIEPTMQVTGYPSIFAAGDVIDFPEQKQVGKYPGHATVVAANVAAVLADQKPSKEYKKQPEILAVTLGSKGGVGYMGFLWGIMVGDWVVASLKSKDLFVKMTRGSLGLKD